MPVAKRPSLAKVVRFLRILLGVVAFGYACVLVKAFSGEGVGLPLEASTHLVIWTIGPPLWFAFEYWSMDGQPERQDGSLKDGQEVIGKVWAAVLIILLYFYPDGPIYNVKKALQGKVSSEGVLSESAGEKASE